VQLVSKNSNLYDPDPPSQTDGQTDGRHAISIPSRGKNIHHCTAHKTSNFSATFLALGTKQGQLIMYNIHDPEKEKRLGIKNNVELKIGIASLTTNRFQSRVM